MRSLVLAVIIGLAVWSGCVAPDEVFECSTHEQCQEPPYEGFCMAGSHWCAFYAGEYCESGFTYADMVPSEFIGKCVPPDHTGGVQPPQ